MEGINEKSVLQIIQENFEKLFPAEQKAAAFILKNPERSVNANVSELANLSGVSDATVIRMCKHLGYEGHYQFRLSLSRDLGRQQGTQGSDLSDRPSDVFQSLANELLEIGRKIGDENLEKAISLIRGANYVHLVAVGNTSPFAQYMGFRLGRLGIRCSYNLLPEYFMNHINLADPKDVVIAISESGTSKSVVQALELSKRKGLKTIAITAYEFSPVSRLADCLLLSSGKERPFDYYKSYAHLKEAAVIDAILHLLQREADLRENGVNTPELLLSETKL
ncbi:MAG TPA: MurR/RpiR family transcriptional regulator [Firmicutes bacterium]|jgi:RpiR family carbohydrate utilization transcriptional regulator|nr:MurR/RpiR family transcriptional regulator [Bacillota bacterium]HHT42092.1 MurR/RpiR family transcriptional regulator [Bacillota bacterium]